MAFGIQSLELLPLLKNVFLSNWWKHVWHTPYMSSTEPYSHFPPVCQGLGRLQVASLNDYDFKEGLGICKNDTHGVLLLLRPVGQPWDYNKHLNATPLKLTSAMIRTEREKTRSLFCCKVENCTNIKRERDIRRLSDLHFEPQKSTSSSNKQNHIRNLTFGGTFWHFWHTGLHTLLWFLIILM